MKIMYINLNKLNFDEEIAATIIRLMMACNDNTLANTCLAIYKDNTTEKNKYINDGACMYFVRQQIGHTHEGLKIIKEISDNPRLKNFVNKCSNDAQQAFQRLCQYILGGKKRHEYEKYFGRIRHNFAFHYHESGDWIKQSLKEKLNIKKQNTAPITLGEVNKTRYNLADQIVDNIVCRKIFGIPYEINFEKDRIAVDKILKFGSDIARDLIGFGGEFIHNYSEENLLI